MIEIDQKSKRAERVERNKNKSENLNSISNEVDGVIYAKPPKNWKHVYLRSEKMRRAKQLGFEYPKRSTRQMLDELDK